MSEAVDLPDHSKISLGPNGGEVTAPTRAVGSIVYSTTAWVVSFWTCG
jgi:hypothetical protein